MWLLDGGWPLKGIDASFISLGSCVKANTRCISMRHRERGSRLSAWASEGVVQVLRARGLPTMGDRIWRTARGTRIFLRVTGTDYFHVRGRDDTYICISLGEPSQRFWTFIALLTILLDPFASISVCVCVYISEEHNWIENCRRKTVL